MSLLRRLEARKGCRVAALSVKRKPSSTFHFDRELCKLECSINYSKSSRKEMRKKSGWDMVCE